MKGILEVMRMVERLNPQTRQNIITTLLTTPTDIDGERDLKTEWKRGDIFLHSTQDTFVAAEVLGRHAPKSLRVPLYPTSEVELRLHLGFSQTMKSPNNYMVRNEARPGTRRYLTDAVSPER